MFKIIVYSFEKRADSTKRVTKELAKYNTEMDCQILDNGCGIIAPVITINYGLVEAPVNFNYAYIPAFKRYYFIKDWTTAEHSLWQGILVEDFLATWRSDIFAYEAYILRAEHRFNRYVEDTLARSQANITIINSDIPNPYNINSSDFVGPKDGYYVVGIVGAQDLAGYSEGGVTYYIFDALHMQLLGLQLMKDLSYMHINWEGDIKKFVTEDLLQSLYNPLQYIASCMWFQDIAADKGTETSTVKLGYWEVQIQCRILKLSEAQDTTVRNIPIPRHPQASLGDWLNLAPYSTYEAHIAPYGIIDVPADELYGASSLAVELVEDYITGNARIMLASAGRRFFNIVNFQIGVTVQVSQITQNPFGAIVSQVAAGVKMATKPSALPQQKTFSLPDSTHFWRGATTREINTSAASTTIHDIAEGIGDIAQAVSSTLQSTGSNGCKAWFRTGESFWRLSGKFVPIATQNIHYCGRPLCEYHTISEMENGFLKCEGASLTFEGNQTEQEVVNSYLNGGFYKE